MRQLAAVLILWSLVILPSFGAVAQWRYQLPPPAGEVTTAPSPEMEPESEPEPEPVTSSETILEEVETSPLATPTSTHKAENDWLRPLQSYFASLDLAIPMGLLAALITGGIVAAVSGMLMVRRWRRMDEKQRQQAAAAVLAMELDARRQAFDVLPLPPGAEAGMSFVSSVIALSRMEQGFHVAMANMHLLPPRLAASVTVHYAAVQRTAAFTYSQSVSAGLRMLQANRIGGNPCPDANAMRAIHQELETAFQGLDKIIQALKAIGRL